MAASDPNGEQKFWFNGQPFPLVKKSGDITGEQQFWFNGSPVQGMIPLADVGIVGSNTMDAFTQNATLEAIPLSQIDGSNTMDAFINASTLTVTLAINGTSTVADFTQSVTITTTREIVVNSNMGAFTQNAPLYIKGIKTYKQEGYVVLSQRLTRLQSLIGFATFSQNQNSLRTLVGYAVLSPLQNVTLALKTDMAELYFAHEFLDFTNPANRAKFHDTNGKPVDLGTTGSLPTGSPPLLYLSLQSVDNSPYLFASNESGAGSLTVETRDSNGVGFGFASTNPSD
jgi:hypothetical protein